MKVFRKILANIYMSIFCRFSSLTLYIGKNNKIQRIFQRQFIKNRLSDLTEI